MVSSIANFKVSERVNVIIAIAPQKKISWMFRLGQQIKDKIVVHKYRKTTVVVKN